MCYNVTMVINVYIEQATLQLNRPFSYECDFPVSIGARVRVPFNHREYIGVVSDVNVVSEYKSLKKVKEVIDKEPLLNKELFDLAKWMSKYYVCSYMSCLKTMLPPALKPSSNHASVVYESYAYEGQSSIPLTVKQSYVLEKIRSSLPMKASEFRKEAKSISKALIEKGYIVLKDVEKNSIVINSYQDTSFELTDEQKNAIETISMGKESIYLLHGVTGSGKTEVFLQLAQRVIEQGKQVLFLVPEIGLTPMMIKRVSARFGSSIAIYHSQLNDQEKYAQYKLVKDNKVSIVVGTRSSVFMPFSNLGLILMDEEHDSSYKQDNTPRYLTKDIVEWRAKYHNCKVVFASATPSLESYARAYKNVYKLVELKQRVNQTMPRIHLVDMKKEKVEYGLSKTLIDQIHNRLDKKEQVILLLNRRGYLPIVRCLSCNEVMTCPDCNLALTYHKQDQSLICHCCGRIFYFHHECWYCHGKEFYQTGMGTEKLEEKISTLFPSANIIRMDADSTRRKNAHSKILNEFEKNGDILIGTQMVAKGLDFEKVTLVGILQADQSLVRNDFSSSEFSYQILEQASGRAGRSKDMGDVYIQTFDTNHFVMDSIVRHDYTNFFTKEMKYRHMGKYPPYLYMATIVYSHKNYVDAFRIATNEASRISTVRVLGPIQISNRRQLNRVRLVLKASNKELLNKVVWEMVTYHQSLKTDVKMDINLYPNHLEE